MKPWNWFKNIFSKNEVFWSLKKKFKFCVECFILLMDLLLLSFKIILLFFYGTLSIFSLVCFLYKRKLNNKYTFVHSVTLIGSIYFFILLVLSVTVIYPENQFTTVILVWKICFFYFVKPTFLIHFFQLVEMSGKLVFFSCYLMMLSIWMERFFKLTRYKEKVCCSASEKRIWLEIQKVELLSKYSKTFTTWKCGKGSSSWQWKEFSSSSLLLRSYITIWLKIATQKLLTRQSPSSGLPLLLFSSSYQSQCWWQSTENFLVFFTWKKRRVSS